MQMWPGKGERGYWRHCIAVCSVCHCLFVVLLFHRRFPTAWSAIVYPTICLSLSLSQQLSMFDWCSAVRVVFFSFSLFLSLLVSYANHWKTFQSVANRLTTIVSIRLSTGSSSQFPRLSNHLPNLNVLARGRHYQSIHRLLTMWQKRDNFEYKSM